MTSEKAYSVEARLAALVAAMPARVWRVTQQANFTSTSQAPVNWEGFAGGDATGIPVLAGTYCVKGYIMAAMGSPNQNVFARFTGPATSMVGIAYQCIQATTVFTSGQATAMGQDMTINMNAGTQGALKFEGIAVFTAPGTLSLAGRISSTTAWAAMGGTYLEASQVA